MHILWIKTEFLHPVDKGGRIRTYQMLRALRRDHRVTYLTLDDGTAAPDAEWRAKEYADVVVRVPFAPATKGTVWFYIDLIRNLASPLPYAIARYESRALREQVKAICDTEDVDVVVCDFLTPSLNVPDDIAKPTVLFQHNVESIIWQRHASVATNFVKRAYMGMQWRRMICHERDECARFDHVIAVSPEDAAVFAQEFGVLGVSDVPTGVDTEFFRPSGNTVQNPYELVFTGSMDWMPNEDAIRWFTEDILPRIRARVPSVSLTVVGRNPPLAVRSLAGKGNSIAVTGSVPDVRPYIERASVFVVPIRIGGGTRLKIFEAMAMERPVVSTTIGAEGLPLRNGLDVVLADEPQSFADAVADLLLDPPRAAAIGFAAANGVRAEHGWERVAARFAHICADIVARTEAQITIPAGAGAITNP